MPTIKCIKFTERICLSKIFFGGKKNAERLLANKGISNTNISAVGGPCLAAGLANRVHSCVVIANKDINTAKKIANMLNTNYYHTSYSDDLNGVEVSAAIKNIFSMAVGAAKGLCNKNISDEIREKNYLNTASALIKFFSKSV